MKRHLITSVILLIVLILTTFLWLYPIITFIIFLCILLLAAFYGIIYSLIGDWLDDHYNKD